MAFSLPFDVDSPAAPPQPYWTSGLWDTGSTGCLITADLAERLELKPIDRVIVYHHDGESQEYVYLIFLYLPSKHFTEVKATACHTNLATFEFIVGMDVISQGDLAISHANNRTFFSFQLPSAKTIDFTKE